MGTRVRNAIQLLKRSVITFGWVTLISHASLSPLVSSVRADDEDDHASEAAMKDAGPRVMVGNQEAEDFKAKQEEALDNAKGAELTDALKGGLQGLKGMIGGQSISQLNAEFRKECQADLGRAEARARGGTNDTGVLDQAAMGQKVLLCGLTKSAIHTAQAERVMQVAWTVVVGVCTTACIASMVPFVGQAAKAGLDKACQLSAMGAGVTSTITQAVLENQVMRGVTDAAKEVAQSDMVKDGLKSKLANVKVDGKALGDTKLGGMAGLEGTGGANATSTGADAGANTGSGTGADGGSNSGGDSNSNSDSSNDKSESCSAIPTSALQMAQHMIKKAGAKAVAADTLAGIRKLATEAQGPGPALSLQGLTGPKVSANDVLGQQPKIEGNEGLKASGDAQFNPADGPCGGQSGMLTLNCASALDPRLGGLNSKEMDDWLNKTGVAPSFFDRDSGPEQLANDLKELTGLPADFGPIVSAAMAEAMGGGQSTLVEKKSAAPSEVSYTQNTGADRAPAAVEEKSLEDIMRELLGAQEKEKADEGPLFDRDLEFRYKKDPKSVAEDAKVSIFRRVSFRYRAVDRKTGFALVVKPSAKK